MTERDERALREALRGLEAAEPVDPAAARRGAAEHRRNRQALVGIATVLVLVVGVVGLPRLLYGGGLPATSAGQADSRAEQAPAGGPASDGGGATGDSSPDRRQTEAQTESAPEGWRTEYYRDISFQVPASWGYGIAPPSYWCANQPERPAQTDPRPPYVWLATAVAVARDGCAEARVRRPLSEHVEALAPGPATTYLEGAARQGDWWIVTRFAGSAVLVVTTKDRARAEQILDSAQVASEDAPCRPASPVAGPFGTRPDAVALEDVTSVERVVVCQYEPALDPADGALPRLRAVRVLADGDATQLVDRLRAAPELTPGCVIPDRDPSGPEVAIAVRITSNLGPQDVYVSAVGCPTDKGMNGGIDDGTVVRVLTREACQQLLDPPIALYSASGGVADSCFR